MSRLLVVSFYQRSTILTKFTRTTAFTSQAFTLNVDSTSGLCTTGWVGGIRRICASMKMPSHTVPAPEALKIIHAKIKFLFNRDPEYHYYTEVHYFITECVNFHGQVDPIECTDHHEVDRLLEELCESFDISDEIDDIPQGLRDMIGMLSTRGILCCLGTAGYW